MRLGPSDPVQGVSTSGKPQELPARQAGEKSQRVWIPTRRCRAKTSQPAPHPTAPARLATDNTTTTTTINSSEEVTQTVQQLQQQQQQQQQQYNNMSHLDDADDWDPHYFEEPAETFESAVDEPVEEETQTSSSAPTPPTATSTTAAPWPEYDKKRKRDESIAEFSKRLKFEKDEAARKWQEHLNHIHRFSDADAVHDAETQLGKWANIHSSHRRSLVGGMVFCRACGKWAAIKTLALARPCEGIPRPHGGLSRLRRMMSGHHPELTASTWPDGSATAQRVRVLELDRTTLGM